MAKKIIEIPGNLVGKELYQFLVSNKSALIAQKKASVKHTEGIACAPEFFNTKEEGGKITKAAPIPTMDVIPEDASSVFVTLVGNACWWCDSQMDVLIPNSAKRSIQQRKGMIPHLADHTYRLEYEVGDVQDIYLEDIDLKRLGVKLDGTTQCILMDSIVQRSYNEKVFQKYKLGKVKQHSIGLWYLDLQLAINQPDDEYFKEEYKIWKKYYTSVLNKEVVDEVGFFWAVVELKLLEISGVVLGSNELTPTLEVLNKNHSPEPATEEAPPGGPDEKAFDVDAQILLTKFFN